jgi:hypothetical protein
MEDKMKKAHLLVVVIMILGLFSGCASTEKAKTITPVANEKMIEQAPSWYLQPPQDDGMVYGTGTATSRDMQMSKDKAAHAARLNIASNLESHFTSLTKRFQEEVGTDVDAQYLEQFTQASKDVVDQTLSGVEQVDLKMSAEGGIFRVYVLLKLDLEAANNRLLEKVKQNEELLTRMRSTEVFQELESTVATDE